MRKFFSKGFITALVALMMLTALFAAMTINASAEGSEPEIVDGVYQIGTADELIWFASLVNGGDYDANAVLTADIDMSGVTDYVPIGNVASYNNTTFSSPSDSYIGTFDGQGHVIKNLTIDGNTSNLTVGIFGTVGSGGVVKNLGVDNYNFVKESNSVDGRYGAVAGLLVASRVENCYVINSTVDADNRVGGVVAGSNYKGYIEYCFTYNCTVSAYENGDEKRYGWIVGDNSIDTGSVALQIKGTVTRCYTDGERISSSTHSGSQNNCHASVSDETFASGSVACSLMYDNSDALWGQNLGTDSIPNLTSATVYSFYYKDCLNNSAGIGYSNIAEDQGTTKQLDHTFSLDDGKCTLCGLQKGVAFTDTSGVPKFYDSITDAISAIKPVVKCGIKLYKDFDLPDAYIDIKNCELTLDLNGKTFAPASFAFAPYVGFGYLTITDSSAEQTGKLILTGSDGALFGNSSTSITLSGGTIEGNVKTSSLFGGITQNGGVINGDLYVYSSCTLNSGKLNGEIIYSYVSKLYIYGGEITTNRLISGTAALNLTITNGTFTYERDGTSVFLDLNDYTTTVAISGGTFVNGLSTTKTLAEHLAAGYAFFDENGNAVILSEGQKDITEYVTVAQCISHDFVSGTAYEASATTHSKKCAACGTASEDAEEHTGGNATCTALAVCSTCNAEYGTVASHTDTNTDNVCDDCGGWVTVFENISLSLGDDLKVNYFISKSSFENPEIRFTVNGCTKTVSGTLVGEQFKFVFDGIAPQWIGDTITAEFIIGGQVKEIKNYSVLEYLNTLKATSAQELNMSTEKYNAMQTLIADLLIYGGAAQSYTGHNTDALVSEGITGTVFTDIDSSDAGMDNGAVVTFQKATVFFDNVNSLRFQFTAGALDHVVFKVKVNNGEEVEIGYIDQGDGSYIILTDAVYASRFDDVYTVTAYKDGVADAAMVYSVKSYAYSKQSGTDAVAKLAKATYNYGLAAKAYKNAQ